MNRIDTQRRIILYAVILTSVFAGSSCAQDVTRSRNNDGLQHALTGRLSRWKDRMVGRIDSARNSNPVPDHRQELSPTRDSAAPQYYRQALPATHAQQSTEFATTKHRGHSIGIENSGQIPKYDESTAAYMQQTQGSGTRTFDPGLAAPTVNDWPPDLATGVEPNFTAGTPDFYESAQTAPNPNPISPRTNGSAQQDRRFRHFSDRLSATERAFQLEDQIERLVQDRNQLQNENVRLVNKLQKSEQLVREMQTSIDDAIEQLTAAIEANRLLRDRISLLEKENQFQQETSEKLIDEVRQQLNDLLASEIAGGK